jgi:hypothetical protein
VVTEILPTANEKSITQMIAERAERGHQLYLMQGALITHEGGDTFTVPSCRGRGTYTVRYGGDVEDCDCVDHAGHGGRISCKHLAAIGIMHSARRRGVKEIRTSTVAAGDPFAHAGMHRECPACFGGYVTITVEEDGQEHDEAVPCRRCSR